MESQEARAARKTVKECEKTLWRLQLGRVEPPYKCQVCGWNSRGMGLVAREHCVLDSVRWTAFFPLTLSFALVLSAFFLRSACLLIAF